MWEKFKQLDYNFKLHIFYGVSAILILYFIWDINTICNAISNNEFSKLNSDIMVNTLIVYDYTLTLGGAIRGIALDIIQIIFLVSFMLVLYIHEVYNGSK